MNCVRGVCELHQKRKCICICRMGCGSTKSASNEEKNVRNECSRCREQKTCETT